MPHPDLPLYRDAFFEKFLAELPGAPTLADLEQRQPSGLPLVLMGDYIEYSGSPLEPLPGASITPRYAVRTAVDGAARTYPLLWVVERIDVASDSRETMVRILADFRRPSPARSQQGGGLASPEAEAWAEALSTAGARGALARHLDQIADVPSGLPTSELDELKTFLAHFGTYKADGTYYPKGTVAEGEFPAGVTPAYLAADTGNLAEVRLQRDSFYCSALVPERLWNAQAPAASFRQLVYRIEDQGQDAAERWRLALLHSASARRDGTPGFSRFVFFHAGVGEGLAVPEGARTTLAASTAELLAELPPDLAAMADLLADPDTPIVGTEQAPYVLLLGAVTADFPSTELPDGVIADGTGAIRTFRCPPQHVMALAERDDIEDLTLSTPVWLTMTDAMNAINFAARTFPAGVTAANTGRGVVVGIVDSGIDGGHPAFLGRHDDPTKTRIHSVWHMWESGGQSPWQRSGQNAAYRAMNFGREYIGHDEAITTRDFRLGPGGGHRPGHGTHVAGIAAGRAFGAWPGGIAPAATIVVAAIGSRGGYINDVIAGVKYCFQKAAELSMPCVVNISLGTTRHSHDGTDPLSIGLTQLVSQSFIPATGLTSMPEFIDGRIICASAGNQRGRNLHWQATIPPGGEKSVLYQPFGRGATSSRPNDGITFWAYNEDGTTVRLRVSARHSTNAVLATGEVGLRASGHAVPTLLPGGLRVNIHNGPERPNNRHFNPEIYWIRPTPAAPVATAPWIVRLRNTGGSACVVHGFAAFREQRGGFVFDSAQTEPLLGITYSVDEETSFESHKVSIPGTGAGEIGVAAFTSRPPAGSSDPVDEIAPFSSPGPLRAAAPGQRAIDVAAPGHAITSAKSWMPSDTSRGVTDMSGTSMATPIITGLIAARLQFEPNLDTGQIRNRLELASTRRPTDDVNDWGLGRVNASVFLRP